jgi:hypothetical protein
LLKNRVGGSWWLSTARIAWRPRQGRDRVRWLDLAGLVEDDHVEAPPRREQAGDLQGAHGPDGFGGEQDVGGFAEEPADWADVAPAGDLGLQQLTQNVTFFCKW